MAWFSWDEALEIADAALAGGLGSARRLTRATTAPQAGAGIPQREEP